MKNRMMLVLPALLLAGSALGATAYVAHAEGEDSGEEVSLAEESVDESVGESSSVAASEEISEQASESVSAEIYECQVKDYAYWIDSDGNKTEDTESKYGDVYITALEGHVGDISTIVVATNFYFSYESSKLSTYRYCIDSVSVNDVKLDAVEGNKYEFVMVEGLNKVDVVYKGTTTVGVTDLTKINIKSLLTVENLVQVASWLLALVLSSGFFITWLKSKKLKAKTTEQVQKATNDEIQTVLSTILPTTLQAIFTPIIEKISEKADDNGKAIASLLKCQLASLSDDPKTKIAIADELMKLQYNDASLNSQVTEIIKNYMADEEAKKASQQKTLEEVKAANESIEVKTEESEEETTDNYGQL